MDYPEDFTMREKLALDEENTGSAEKRMSKIRFRARIAEWRAWERSNHNAMESGGTTGSTTPAH